MGTSMFVTGATGLVGANVCRLAIEQGNDVRALVRPGSDAEPLQELGVSVVRGDVTDFEVVREAAKDAELVIHMAALLAGATPELEPHFLANWVGSQNTFDAARAVGARRTVWAVSPVLFDLSVTLTEEAKIPLPGIETAYAITKRMVYLDALRRVDMGQDINFVCPGGTYGPSPLVERAMARSSFNSHLRRAIVGEVKKWVEWNCIYSFVDDVAEVILRAGSRGGTGKLYLALGREEDVSPYPVGLSRVCELAGSPNRVESVSPFDVPEGKEAEVGGINMVQGAKRGSPDPFFDAAVTRKELDIEFTSFDEGVTTTIEWFREHGII
jgi:nucleoside-diphosphate-sugar epimerase